MVGKDRRCHVTDISLHTGRRSIVHTLVHTAALLNWPRCIAWEGFFMWPRAAESSIALFGEELSVTGVHLRSLQSIQLPVDRRWASMDPAAGGVEGGLTMELHHSSPSLEDMQVCVCACLSCISVCLLSQHTVINMLQMSASDTIHSNCIIWSLWTMKLLSW